MRCCAYLEAQVEFAAKFRGNFWASASGHGDSSLLPEKLGIGSFRYFGRLLIQNCSSNLKYWQNAQEQLNFGTQRNYD